MKVELTIVKRDLYQYGEAYKAIISGGVGGVQLTIDITERDYKELRNYCDTIETNGQFNQNEECS